MIARVWRGSTAPDNAAPYVEHLRTATFPALRAIGGHRGAYALRRDEEASTEFLVVTLWVSVDAIRAFAGDDVELAVVPPEAVKLLDRHDERAIHYEVALASEEA